MFPLLARRRPLSAGARGQLPPPDPPVLPPLPGPLTGGGFGVGTPVRGTSTRTKAAVLSSHGCGFGPRQRGVLGFAEILSFGGGVECKAIECVTWSMFYTGWKTFVSAEYVCMGTSAPRPPVPILCLYALPMRLIIIINIPRLAERNLACWSLDGLAVTEYWQNTR